MFFSKFSEFIPTLTNLQTPHVPRKFTQKHRFWPLHCEGKLRTEGGQLFAAPGTNERVFPYFLGGPKRTVNNSLKINKGWNLKSHPIEKQKSSKTSNLNFLGVVTCSFNLENHLKPSCFIFFGGGSKCECSRVYLGASLQHLGEVYHLPVGCSFQEQWPIGGSVSNLYFPRGASQIHPNSTFQMSNVKLFVGNHLSITKKN